MRPALCGDYSQFSYLTVTIVSMRWGLQGRFQHCVLDSLSLLEGCLAAAPLIGCLRVEKDQSSCREVIDSAILPQQASLPDMLVPQLV